ncbi:chlorophyllase-1-like [Impatiens glandulifera]|uniref:chlorophyllase-1-like n=1 Tax=Impatiens glandulifera TaxID=253017 RepID=UPI001FB18B22|nr:chlorophyllase-1-like [Impatiens glandulifera]
MGTNVFEKGSYLVESLSVKSSESKPILIVTPTEEGEYPVLLFFHGFLITDSAYSKLLHLISSHGYILVAPQLSTSIFTSGNEEVKSAAGITNWLVSSLGTILSSNNFKSVPNLNKVALAGHSRGGRNAFALALGYGGSLTLKFSVLIGIDPVAGLSKCLQMEPKILTYNPKSFNIGIPVAVLGTGLGIESKCCGLMPACAPEGVNHDEFFDECKPPRWHFLVKDFGHMDMLDDSSKKLSSCICKSNGGDWEPFRKCLAGILVAIMRACLDDVKEDIQVIVNNPSVSPTPIDVQYEEE